MAFLGPEDEAASKEADMNELREENERLKERVVDIQLQVAEKDEVIVSLKREIASLKFELQDLLPEIDPDDWA